MVPSEPKRNARVRMRWDREYTGRIVEPGPEVSGMAPDDAPDKIVRYFPNDQYEVVP